MRFELPNAVAAMNNAVAAVDSDGDAWEVIGTPLDRPVDDVLPEYDRTLELNLDPSGGDKRLEVCGLHWGRIGKDVARLQGLATAIDNISGVVRSGKDQLAHDWKGEAFDAFRQAIEKVEKTLDDYAAAVRTTAAGIETALKAVEADYTTYRDDTVGTHLNFTEVSPPADWWKMSHDNGEFLAEHCTSYHGGVVSPVGDRNCCYNDDEQQAIIHDRFVNNRLFDRLESWDCTDDPGVVIDQYRTTVEDAREEKDLIVRKINNWYRATDQLKENVDLLFGTSLDNLRIIAEVKPFATLAVPGATAAATAGPEPAPSSDPGPAPGGGPGPASGGGPGPAPGGDPVPVAGGDAASPGPGGGPAASTPAGEASPQPTEPGTVEIKDADRTISVTTPDGEGHVKVTVEDETGNAKTYDLDFNAASGMGRGPTDVPTPPADPNAEPVLAGTNGKCVIQNGPLTITAERSLFDEGTLTLTVDDGTTPKPTTYTLDFAADPTPEPAASAAPTPAAPDSSAPTATGASAESSAATASEPPPGSAPPDSAAPGAGEPPAAGDPNGTDSAAHGVVVAATAAPAEDAPSTSEERPDPRTPTSGSTDRQSGPASPPAGPTTPAGAAGLVVEPSVGAAGLAAEAGQSSAGSPAGPDAQAAQPVTQDQTPSSAVGEPAAAGWDGDRSGTLSGVLVPEQSDGEAEIASAGADQPAGAVGAGMPMMAGAGAGNAEAGGRVGTGWSVHGDLFDSADPVYSMHGVLGEDDVQSQ